MVPKGEVVAFGGEVSRSIYLYIVIFWMYIGYTPVYKGDRRDDWLVGGVLDDECDATYPPVLC